MIKLKTTQGFTLIELSIVIIITGVALAGAIEAYKVYSEKQKIENTKSVLADINQSLKEFPNTIDPATADPNTGLGGSLYKRLPCPDADGDGREDCTMATVQGRRFDGAPNGPSVMVGALPYSTLGLAMDYATDPYGSPILYGITQSAANATSFGTGIGAIQITDDDGNQTYTNQYVVVSTGRLGCGGDGADAENCDGDADFIAAFQTEGTGQYYDDRVIHNAQVPTLVNTNEPAGCEQYDTVTLYGDSCPDGWEPMVVPKNIYNVQNQNAADSYVRGDILESEPNFLPYFSETISDGHYNFDRGNGYFNIDPETGDYYVSNFATPSSVNRDVSSASQTVTCEKKNNDSGTKCFSKQVVVRPPHIVPLQVPAHTVTEEGYNELNENCPDGYKAVEIKMETRYGGENNDRPYRTPSNVVCAN